MVEIKNYLSLDGLKLYDELIKKYIATADEAVLNQILGDLKSDADPKTIAELNALIKDVTGTAGTALQGITKGKDGDFVTTTVGTKGEDKTQSVAVSVKTAALTDTEDGLVTASDARTELNKKVDKVEGKGLSTNDFTNDLKTKLEGIAAGAEVNVQADWDETDKNSDAFIKNKPANLVQDANYVHTDKNYTTAEKTKLEGVEAGAQVNVIEAINVNGVDATIADKKATITIPEATTSASGVMSAADKTKLDGLANIKSVGEHLAVDGDGKLTVTIPEATVTGVDGTTVNGMKLSLDGTNVKLVDDGLKATLSGKDITLDVAETATEGYLKTYVLKQGTTEIGKIDLPKELVVTGGDVIIAKDEAGLTTGEKYLKLTIANQDKPVYIAVTDLVDVYKAGAGIAISDANVVSVKLAEKQGNVVLDTTNGLKANLEGWETVQAASHTHNNKTVLDGITAEKVSAWDAKQDAMTAITNADIEALFPEVTSL